ncbi:hypothetical protein XENTR_v10004652 [Xenopus tropicalis]|nr:hypothetical protein XENTR_v10004652 [Xenopus tropicalis]
MYRTQKMAPVFIMPPLCPKLPTLENLTNRDARKRLSMPH